MGMVAPQQRIASAYFVVFGNYGDVTRYAAQRGVCRQWIYREATALQQTLAQQQTIERLHSRVGELQQQVAGLEERLSSAVVIDSQLQARFASVGQAGGVSLPMCWQLLDVLIPGQQDSVATLGRATQAAGKKSGELLAILDAWACERVRELNADEIYVKDAVLMTVEPESLCWLSGHLSAAVSGTAWAKEFGQFPNLEQVQRDGGTGLAKGLQLINAQRQEQGLAAVVDQGDHFHALRDGGVGLRKAEQQARQALAAAEAADRALAECDRQGHNCTGPSVRARLAWQKAEQAMDAWSERQRLWQQAKDALRLFTPNGELNTRPQATAALTQSLAQLPDTDFAKAKRSLQKPEMLNYLDRVQTQIEALPFAPQIKQAAVRQEGLRRHAQLLQGESSQAAALRGVLLMCAVVLSQAGAVGEQAVIGVRDVLRRAYRASSLVECINSVLRMQQARHRKMTQGLLDLKRLYWNCHTFRTGHRRGSTPYQRLGVPWPEGLRWWELLKMTPEQLADKLSTAKMPL
jgi:hypothetical protein